MTLLVVSIFCQSMLVYAKQQQKQKIQCQQKIEYQLTRVAVALDGKKTTLQRKKDYKKNKKLQKKLKLRRKRIAARKRRRAAAARIVKYANKFVGNPYVWGGNSLTHGCDCSHFVYNVIKDTTKYSGGYTTSRNWAYLGKAVPSIKKAQAGDVIVYSGHVAIYDGKGKIIQAQSSSAGITNNRSATSTYIIAIRRFI